MHGFFSNFVWMFLEWTHTKFFPMGKLSLFLWNYLLFKLITALECDEHSATWHFCHVLSHTRVSLLTIIQKIKLLFNVVSVYYFHIDLCTVLPKVHFLTMDQRSPFIYSDNIKAYLLSWLFTCYGFTSILFGASYLSFQHLFDKGRCHA